MSQLNSILSLFKITDKNIMVTKFSTKISPNRLHIHIINAVLINDPIRCPHCSFKTLIKNGKHLSYIRLGTLKNVRYQLDLNKQRYLLYHNCYETCSTLTDIVQTNATFSNNIKQQLITLDKKSLPKKTIAEILAISNSSVQRILSGLSKQPYRIKSSQNIFVLINFVLAII